MGASAVWCAKRDLNPYGKTTRPSNVRVCQFRHSRKNSSIIAKSRVFVKPFFEKSGFFYFPPGAAPALLVPTCLVKIFSFFFSKIS